MVSQKPEVRSEQALNTSLHQIPMVGRVGIGMTSNYLDLAMLRSLLAVGTKLEGTGSRSSIILE